MAISTPFFDLNRLPDPPTDYLINQQSDKTLIDRYSLNQHEALVRYHGYGFNLGEPRTKADFLALFKKIHSHRQTREGNMGSGVDSKGRLVCLGDVGPATFDLAIRIQVDLPDWYLTSENARRHIQPHQWMQDRTGTRPGPKQRLTNIATGTGNFTLASPVQQPSREPPKDTKTDHSSAEKRAATALPTSSVQRPPTTLDVPGTTSTGSSHDDLDSRSVRPARAPRTERASAQSSEVNSPFPPIDPFTPIDPFAPTERANHPPVSSPVKSSDDNVTRLPRLRVTEAAKRIQRRSPYERLKRHPDIHFGSRLVAKSGLELMRAFSTASPANSHVAIFGDIDRGFHFNGTNKTDNMEQPGDNGTPPSPRVHRLRGRGPVWSGNSCYIDSVIASCLLLDAGSTVEDRKGKENWYETLPLIERNFYDALIKAWMFYNDITSQRERDIFRQAYINFYNQSKKADDQSRISMSNMGSVFQLWNSVAPNFGQFQFTTRRRIRSCACKGTSNLSISPASTQLSVDPGIASSDENGVAIENLFARFFRTQLACRACRRPNRVMEMVVTDELPLRLALQVPNRNALLLGHTSPRVSFRYPRAQNSVSDAKSADALSCVDRTATYRWLGGIYYELAKRHYVVVWADDTRNDSPSSHPTEPPESSYRTVTFYDGMQLWGSIIGGCELAEDVQAAERVPKKFLGECPPIVFYERVIDTEDEAEDEHGRLVNVSELTGQIPSGPSEATAKHADIHHHDTDEASSGSQLPSGNAKRKVNEMIITEDAEGGRDSKKRRTVEDSIRVEHGKVTVSHNVTDEKLPSINE